METLDNLYVSYTKYVDDHIWGNMWKNLNSLDPEPCEPPLHLMSRQEFEQFLNNGLYSVTKRQFLLRLIDGR